MAPANEQRILITQASPGMVLAQPVILPNKVALCARGTILSDALITRLMVRGIKRIIIQGTALPGPSQAAYAETIHHLHQRFDRVRHYPTMASLEIIVERAMVKYL
jgi:hypothetical protein